jgi:hypothetical protein
MTPCASEQHLLEIALFSLECFNDINAATRRMMLALGYSEPAEGEPVPLTNDLTAIGTARPLALKSDV